MAKKPVKFSDKNKKNKAKKDPNKFHFGRNLGTYLIILGTILGLVLIYVVIWCTLTGTNSYRKLYVTNKHHPFIETDEDDPEAKYNFPNAEYVEAKDFNKLDIEFYAKSIDSKDAHNATFSLKAVKNENTESDIQYIDSGLETISTSTSVVLYSYVCLSADWVGLNAYSSLKSTTRTQFEKTLDESNAVTHTVSIDSEISFPAKANTWPVKVTVKTPDAYLFLCYIHQENGLNKVKQYVVHYTYDEYYIPGTTSPAI